MKQCHKWIEDPIARSFWSQHASRLEEDGILTPLSEASYGLLCQLYADYRNATDSRIRNKCMDNYLKLAGKFSLILHISLSKNLSETPQDKIDPALAKLIKG